MKGADVSRALLGKKLTLETLIARAEIEDVLVRYCHSIDHHDWDLLESVFADECYIDFSSSVADGKPRAWKPKEIVEWVSEINASLDAVQHGMFTFAIDVNGDEADCVSYLSARCTLDNNSGDDHYHSFGYYFFGLRRIGGEWKITKCDLRTTMTDGNFHIIGLARQHSAAKR